MRWHRLALLLFLLVMSAQGQKDPVPTRRLAPALTVPKTTTPRTPAPKSAGKTTSFSLPLTTRRSHALRFASTTLAPSTAQVSSGSTISSTTTSTDVINDLTTPFSPVNSTKATFIAQTGYTASSTSFNMSLLNLIRDRIVGGRSIDISVLPYQVSLRYNNEHVCGGSIISPSWVLTAAHCVQDTAAADLSIQAGSSTITDDTQGFVHQVQQIVAHAQYNMYTTENDICALKVKPDFKFGPKLKALALPDPNEVIVDYTYCTISGWGYTEEEGTTSPDLQVVLLPVIPLTVCQEIFGPGVIRPSMICAGISEGGQDACQGDSGGPMQCLGKLVGIVSWGEGCARRGFPGVYTRVSKFNDWVQTTTGVASRAAATTTPAPKKKPPRPGR